MQLLIGKMDPFDDIDGIVQVKEEEVSVNDSTMFNRQISDEQSYIESFPPALRQKAAADKSTRYVDSGRGRAREIQSNQFLILITQREDRGFNLRYTE